jgi:type III secretion system low calcium response chaperone LcrH/SycD
MSNENNDIPNNLFRNDTCCADRSQATDKDGAVDESTEDGNNPEEENNQKEELYAAAYFLFQHKQYSKACRIFSILCQIDPHDARFYRGVGACWEKQGELEKAARAYKYASMMRITDAMLHFQYAFCLVRLGRYDEAEFPLQMTIANAAMHPKHKSLESKANALIAHIERCKGEKND